MRKRILLVSWRDLYNPKKGGAEIFDYEIFSRLISKGYTLTWLAPKFPNAKDEEIIDGIKYIRIGNFFNIHWHAINFINKYKNDYDIIIDELHGYPFFINLYSNKPKLTIVHEVPGEIWFQMLKFPISLIGFLFEKCYFLLLKNQYFICPSLSTKEDIIKQGIKSDKILLTTEGSNTQSIKSLRYKKNENQFCFVGRICKMKGITTLLESFSIVVKQIPNAKLYLVGKVDPAYKKELDSLMSKYNLYENVVITGFVTKEEREQIMKQSKFLLSCSVKEGFGLIVVESNSLGTPAITFNVNGYKDIIIDGQTGFLVQKQDPEEFAAKIINSLSISDYKTLQKNTWENSKKYNWDDAVVEFEKNMNLIVDKQKSTLHNTNLISKLFVRIIFGTAYILGNVASLFKIV